LKTSAAIASTSIVGLGLATLAAVPAQAAEVTTPCESVEGHYPSETGVSDNWYMDCVPQYGLGKVEFTIDSDVDLPAGFAPLEDASVTSTSANTGPAATEYFESMSPIAGFTHLEEVGGSATERHYQGTMMFAISGVSAIDVSALPDDCDPGPYANAYRVDYLPATVTFTQTIDGVTWTTVVTYTPSPLYLGLNFADDPFDFDGSAVQCASSDTGTRIGDPEDIESLIQVLNVHASALRQEGQWLGSLSPFPAIEGFSIGQLGTFAANPDPNPDPELAETGAESTGLGLAGGVSILAGALLAFFWRRRRSRGEA
jgi:LPXTG-motif cell wall-anchored protein